MIFPNNHHPKKLRLTIYSQDGFGLGHMRRTNSIAKQFLRSNPDSCILTLSDSPLGQIFGVEKNHDYLKLPSIIKSGPGNWKPINLSVPFEEVLTMRQSLIRSAVLCFEPQLLLVDHMPHGAMGELLPTLQAIKDLNTGTQVVLGLRDILDAPDVIQQRWKAEGAYNAIEEFYDRVLVYGMQEVYNLADEYQFESPITKKLRYCGYVCTPAVARYTARARSQTIPAAKAGAKMILVMAGGGADAYPMMRAALETMPRVLAKRPCVMVIVTGPFMPIEQRHDLEARARGLPVRVRNTVSDILSYLEASDLVVSMAGYNTTIEILRSRKPAILIPRVGPSAEQRTRAKLFADRSWVQAVDPVEIRVDHLAEEILANLEDGSGPRQQMAQTPDLDGVQSAVQHLLSLVPVDQADIKKICQTNLP